MSTFTLKVIAIIAMTLDHLQCFNLALPLYFRWIGRIAAPIFIFCTVQAFIHTKNRKKLMLRLYIANVIVAILGTIFGFTNNVIGSLFVMTIILYIIDLKNCSRPKKAMLLILFTLYQILIPYAVVYIEDYDSIVYIVVAVFGILIGFEGGFATLYVLSGVLMYLTINNKIRFSFSYILFCIMYFVLTTTDIIGRAVSKFGRMGMEYISETIEYVSRLLALGPFDVGGHFLYQNFNWMMVFSLPFFLAYNGKKGRSFKWFFYIYYPLHLIVLSLIFPPTQY